MHSIFRFTHSHNPDFFFFFSHACWKTFCNAFKDSVNKTDNKFMFIHTSHSSLYLSPPFGGTIGISMQLTLKRHSDEWKNNTEH